MQLQVTYDQVAEELMGAAPAQAAAIRAAMDACQARAHCACARLSSLKANMRHIVRFAARAV